MSSLRRCSKCGSFVASEQCPSCGSVLLRATKLGLLATALGSGAFAMTLMACYGCPDCTFEDYDAGDANADANTKPAENDAGSDAADQ